MTPDQIPYLVHESMIARQERTIRRLWILCIIIFVAFVGSNAVWIYYENQFIEEEIVQEVTQDAADGGTVRYNGKMVGEYHGETGD